MPSKQLGWPTNRNPSPEGPFGGGIKLDTAIQPVKITVQCY
jgi:hypothetical protein